MEVHRVQFSSGNDDIILETGKIGKQANGSIFATQGGTAVFSAAVASRKAVSMDYFPLQVHYSAKYYAAGKIPGGFIKREGRPRDKEVLVSRLIDRPIRPLFPRGFMNEVQVLPTTISVDHVNPPDILAMIAAAASVSISDIPFDGPVGAVRIGLIDGQYIVNPTCEQIENSSLNLVVAGSHDAILMVEGHAENIEDSLFLDAMSRAHEAIKKICDAIGELVASVGRDKMSYEPVLVDEDLKQEVSNCAYTKIKAASSNSDKLARLEAVNAVFEETMTHFVELGKTEKELNDIESTLHDLEKDIVRREIIDHEMRPDGRKLDEIRDLSMELSLLPRAHGSALFTRGQTQAMAVTTLGTAMDAQRVDDVEGEGEKRFMLHYNFPQFSVGETGRIGAVGRREIGHGMLAERALKPVMPEKEDFPYTVRIVSEIMESNGSSSMASVCGGCLALMDAGVPISDVVAGIAMGLVMDSEGGGYQILTDIQGVEDHLGDMDFKVAGTQSGITAFQMDIKVKGITFEIFSKALDQAGRARMFILKSMKEVIATPRPEISRYAPRISTIKIDPEMIGAIIGKGGETIRGIQEDTGAKVEISDDGTIVISAVNVDCVEAALKIIEGMTAEVEVGELYTGTVKKITDFGAFIEILPGKDGLCHISKLTERRARKVSDVCKEGDTLKVRVVDIDKLGRINLSALGIKQ